MGGKRLTGKASSTAAEECAVGWWTSLTPWECAAGGLGVVCKDLETCSLAACRRAREDRESIVVGLQTVNRLVVSLLRDEVQMCSGTTGEVRGFGGAGFVARSV